MRITDWIAPDGSLCSEFDRASFPVPLSQRDFMYCTAVANNIGSPYALWDAIIAILKAGFPNFVEAFAARSTSLQTLF